MIIEFVFNYNIRIRLLVRKIKIKPNKSDILNDNIKVTTIIIILFTFLTGMYGGVRNYVLSQGLSHRYYV